MKIYAFWCVVITVLFAALKITGVLSVSWWLVIIPWLPVIFVAFLFIYFIAKGPMAK